MITKYKVDFEYREPRWGEILIELDPTLDKSDKEEIAAREIRDVYGDDVQDIEITEVKEI